jgi:hypothetical protein
VKIYDFLERVNLNTRTQYKKWLDVSSSHFLLSKDYPEDYANLKRIVRNAKEVFLESGRHLVFVSSGHYYTNTLGEKIPVFLLPVRLDSQSKERIISWACLNDSFILNPELHHGQVELVRAEIETWLEQSGLMYSVGSLALYFDLNHNAYIQRDLQIIKKAKWSSSALDSLWNDDYFAEANKPYFA